MRSSSFLLPVGACVVSFALVACGEDGESVPVCEPTEYLADSGDCLAITECAATEYIAVSATETSDATCAPLTVCDDGEEETVAPTASANRVCTPCEANEYETGGVCTALTVCGDGLEESVPPTATSDRVCSACGLGRYGVAGACFDLTVCAEDEYESTPATAATDRACDELTVCEATEFESEAPTATSDRECTTYTMCAPGESLVTEGTETADYVCQACEGGYSTTENAASCTPWAVECMEGDVELLSATPTRDRSCTSFDDATVWVTQSASESEALNGADIAVGSDGRVAIVGQSMGPLGIDVLVIVYDDEGTEQWRDVFGAATGAVSEAITVDDDGNVIVVGSEGVPGPEMGPPDFEAFVRKYDVTGELVFSHRIGTTAIETGNDVAVDAEGNIFVLGETTGAFPGQTNAEGADLFVRKHDATGAEVWTVQIGTESGKAMEAANLALNGEGHILVAGSIEMDGVFMSLPSVGGDDVAVLDLDPTGALVWARRFGTGGHDYPSDIAVDGHDDVLVTWGRFGTITLTAYVQKLDADGEDLWTHEIATAENVTALDVATDDEGNVFVSGGSSMAFPGQPQLGGFDAYVRKLDSAGNAAWTRSFGSNAHDMAFGVVVDLDGNALVLGYTDGALPGQTVSLGGSSAFVVAFAP